MLWTVAHQAPLSMGFSRQEYWSGLPCPSPGDLPHLGIEPKSLMSPALAGGFFTTSATWEAHVFITNPKVNTFFSCFHRDGVFHTEYNRAMTFKVNFPALFSAEEEGQSAQMPFQMI